jgi:hypothetical protein
MDQPLIIFAGNYSQAEHYARGIGIRSHRQFIYAAEPQRIRGRRGSQAVITGTFWHDTKPHVIEELMQIAKVQDFRFIDH